MRIFESFAGYGSHRLACNRQHIKVESVGVSEVDTDAIIAYASLHCDMEDYIDLGLTIDEKKKILMDCNVGYDFKKEKSSIPRMKKDKLELLFRSHILSHNKGDISLIDPQTLPEMDLFTYSFPCTNISVAGKQEGMEKDSGTSSSLLWECEKIIKSKCPKFLMMENVKALVNKKNIEHFEVWLSILTNLGYNNYWKVINAKNCGVPQNRERVFCVSILKEFDDGNFKFEDDFDNGVRLKDMLENEVDEKYYIDDERYLALINLVKQMKRGSLPNKTYQSSSALSSWEHRGSGWSDDVIGTLCARDYKDPKVVCIPNEINQVGNISNSDSFNGNPQTGRIYAIDGISPTLNTCGGGQREPKVLNNYRIRKLTPTECFRLMGLTDEEIKKIQNADISNSQQYKMAGNSIVVDCMTFLRNLPKIDFY